MGFFTKLSNGWTITMNSFSVLQKNKQLILFPILSGVSLILIMGSFLVGMLGYSDWDITNIETDNRLVTYGVTFVFYVINYFVVVFFNMALIHCTKMYFEGEEVTVAEGIKFSMSRIGVIFSWALFAATVGTILKAIQENTGFIGKLITGLIGIVWGVTTFFVVPIIAYENLGPIAAFKRSAQLMKEKWGESLGATFSLGLIQMVAILLVAIPAVFIGMYVNLFVGIAIGALSVFLIIAIISAAETIFIGSVYHNVTGNVDEHFNQLLLDGLFEQKKEKTFL